MDEIRIWGASRSSSQIAASMNKVLTQSEPDLLASWSFQGMLGNIIWAMDIF
jgi:hypothetical protein